MNALKEIISDLVDKEKTSAIKNHGYAHSDHEALGAGQNIRPSRAFEKEQEARKQGLHYADLQKAETLRLYGRVER